jgi:Arc/MetJ family transcription regulator
VEIELEVDIDDDLLARASEYSGLNDVSAIVTVALKALIEREEIRRSTAGSTPDHVGP